MDNNLRKFQHLPSALVAEYFSVFGLRLWPNVRMQLRSFTVLHQDAWPKMQIFFSHKKLYKNSNCKLSCARRMLF